MYESGKKKKDLTRSNLWFTSEREHTEKGVSLMNGV